MSRKKTFLGDQQERRPSRLVPSQSIWVLVRLFFGCVVGFLLCRVVEMFDVVVLVVVGLHGLMGLCCCCSGTVVFFAVLFFLSGIACIIHELQVCQGHCARHCHIVAQASKKRVRLSD